VKELTLASNLNYTLVNARLLILGGLNREEELLKGILLEFYRLKLIGINKALVVLIERSRA
jgi:hypothetical protein